MAPRSARHTNVYYYYYIVSVYRPSVHANNNVRHTYYNILYNAIMSAWILYYENPAESSSWIYYYARSTMRNKIIFTSVRITRISSRKHGVTLPIHRLIKYHRWALIMEWLSYLTSIAVRRSYYCYRILIE